MLAHAGLSISLSSIHAAVTSLSENATKLIKAAVRTLTTSLAYDNFDINFTTSQSPTLEHQTTFVSATSATAIPLFGVDNPEVLRCSAALWSRNPLNPSPIVLPFDLPKDDVQLVQELHTQEEPKKPGERLSPRLKRFAWHVRDILIKHGGHFKDYAAELKEPDAIWVIPLHKTTQVPCRAMKIKESTIDGNIQVIENLHQQGGIGEPDDPKFAIACDVDMSEWVLLVHGDLLTKERVESIQATRSIEDTPKRRFQHIIFVPGLFHYKMACADAFWRTWVKPTSGRKDANSLYEHVGILTPDETGKFGSKPGFRRVHDVIHHDLWASMLDCWRVEVGKRDPSWTTLEAFAKAKPTWDTIVNISESIVDNYVATTGKLRDLRDKELQERDQRFENQILRNRDELSYVELCHAMNAGDIGRVEASFLPWCLMFKATGKHKYASHILRFMHDLKTKYSAELR